MGVVRTVLGDVEPDTLGFTHCHEHLFVFPVRGVDLGPKLRLDDYERTRREVAEFREAGGATLVDAQPFGAGRHPELQRRLSGETGVAVVAATGLHRRHYYPPAFWAWRAPAEELAVLLGGEIQEGMYAYAPEPEEGRSRRTAVRAGIIKVATDAEGVAGAYRRLFEAAAAAHRATGAPVMTHAEAPANGPEQARFLLERGVPAAAIIVSHMDRVIDLPKNLALARLGVYLEYDTLTRLKYHDDAAEVALIRAMVEAGFGGQLLLGMDVTRERLPAYGGRYGLAHLRRAFLPLLRQGGVAEETIRAMTLDNPRRALALLQRRKRGGA